MRTIGVLLGILAGATLSAGCGEESGSTGPSGTGGGAGATTSGNTSGTGGTTTTGPCSVDADCPDDGLYCNGAPKCVAELCQSDAIDCGSTPAGCASIQCDEESKACLAVPFDDDGDGHGKMGCADGSLPDDDCDDADEEKFPGNWDGPAGDGHAGACDDGVDQDCTGPADDGKLADGTTCICTPGATMVCGVDTGSCQTGLQTCTTAGEWGTDCVGEIKPVAEICDGLDNDCSGTPDEGNPGSGIACGTGQPGPCAGGFTNCQGGGIVCTPTNAPTGETCDGIDNDCDGPVDEGFGVGNTCDGGDSDVCKEGNIICNGSGGTACNDFTGSTSDNCDTGNDSDCNGSPNQGCTCINGISEACGDGTCGYGSHSCSGGVYPTSCSGDPQPTCHPTYGCTSAQGSESTWTISDFWNICHNCSGPAPNTLFYTSYYQGPQPGGCTVSGTATMQYIGGGCFNNATNIMHLECYDALPGCAEPPETWGGAYRGTVNFQNNSNGQAMNLPASSPGRILCCDLHKYGSEWTPCAQPCCNRRVDFNWQLNCPNTCW